MNIQNKILFMFKKAIHVVLLLLIVSTCSTYSQWSQTSGPVGGTINKLKSDPNGIYACTDGAGLCFSSNNGSNWVSLNNNCFNALFVYSVGFLNNNIYIGTAAGVYRTSNFGLNWISLNNLGDCTSLLIVNNNIFAGTLGGGIYLSTDFGNNWFPVNNGLPSFLMVNTLISRNNIIYAGTEDYNNVGRVYKSTDNGNSWNSFSSGLNVINVLDLCYAGANLFAGCYPGIYMSTNDGSNWTQVMSTGWVSAVTSKDNLVIAGTGDGILESTNNGVSWISKNNGISNTSIETLLVNGNIVFAGNFKSLNNSGVYFTTDNGNNWSFSSSGIKNTYINSMTQLNGTIYATDIYMGVFKSTDMGNSWNVDNNGVSNCSIYSICSKDSILFLGTSPNGVYVSTNYGLNWINRNSGLPGNIRVNSFIVDGSNILAGTSNGSYISSDNGNNWNLGGLSQNVNCYSSEGNRLAAGCSNGVYLSTNHGSVWQHIGLSEYIYSILCKNNVLYAGTSNGIYVSTNNGINWQNINYGSFYFIISLVAAGDYVLAGTGANGVYLTVNNGLNWTQVNDGMLPLQINSFLVSNGFIFAGTAGQSIWKRQLSEVIGISDPGTSIPKSFKLYQNYPNPFNPSTTIKFDLSKNANVSIRVYDVNGRVITSLAEGDFKTAGSYQVTWDASKFSSGIYFYKLFAGEFVSTKKMVLIK